VTGKKKARKGAGPLRDTPVDMVGRGKGEGLERRSGAVKSGQENEVSPFAATRRKRHQDVPVLRKEKAKRLSALIIGG